MDGDVELLKRIYDRFNARDIDGVLAVLADDVAWANGMDGGHVHGREAVREYWTRQCPSSRGQGGSLRHTGCCLIPIFTESSACSGSPSSRRSFSALARWALRSSTERLRLLRLEAVALDRSNKPNDRDPGS